MAGFHWGNAFDAFRDLEREVDRLLSSVGRGLEGIRFGRPFPPVNIYDLDTEFLLTAELPGTKAEDFDLSVVNGALVIKGRRTAEDGIAEERYRRNERPRGEWERTIPLPDRVRHEDIRAELRHGVLRLHLPKAASSQPRQIPVQES